MYGPNPVTITLFKQNNILIFIKWWILSIKIICLIMRQNHVYIDDGDFLVCWASNGSIIIKCWPNVPFGNDLVNEPYMTMIMNGFLMVFFASKCILTTKYTRYRFITVTIVTSAIELVISQKHWLCKRLEKVLEKNHLNYETVIIRNDFIIWTATEQAPAKETATKEAPPQ